MRKRVNHGGDATSAKGVAVVRWYKQIGETDDIAGPIGDAAGDNPSFLTSCEHGDVLVAE
jgi:hypothetical protein